MKDKNTYSHLKRHRKSISQNSTSIQQSNTQLYPPPVPPIRKLAQAS